MMASCCCDLVEAGQVANGSFELDGSVADLATRAPNGWTVDRVVPSLKAPGLKGAVDAAWATEGHFSLVCFTQTYAPLRLGDRLAVSQQVDLTDVNEIVFDAKLDSYFGSPWEPDVCSAVVSIDGETVWSGNAGGTFLQEACRVDDVYRDGRPHQLALGLKVDADRPYGVGDYFRVRWDNVHSTAFACEAGRVVGDVNRDCRVDRDDLAMMAATWMADVPSESRYNLSTLDDVNSVGIVNFFDLAVLGGNWLSGSLQEQ